MKRILMMVFRNILLVPYMWCKLCYYASHVEKYTEKQRYDMLKFIVKRANRGGNVHIDVHGQDNIPKEDGFMFFPNHQGLYDVLAMIETSPRFCRCLPRTSIFCCCKTGSEKCAIFKTGIRLHESIYNRS